MTTPTLVGNPPRVGGLDISLTASGLAWPHRVAVHGLKGLTTLSPGPREHQLWRLAEQLFVKISDPEHGIGQNPGTRPVLVVVENLPTGRTAGGVVSTEKGYVYHEVIRLLHYHGIPVLEVAPSVIKKYATGKGNANKGAVIEATARRMPWLLTAGDDNACDAAWAMAIGCALLGQPVVDVPKLHQDALTKLRLPAAP
jgi:crossover junction endodeoxyribonuclease RuvC